MSRADRMYALDHLGLPQGFHPSRASSLKLAADAGRRFDRSGQLQTDGSDIVAEARVVDVPHLRMSEAVTARGEMRNMIDVFDSLAWKLTRQLDPGFSVAEETFVAAGKGCAWTPSSSTSAASPSRTRRSACVTWSRPVKLSPDFSPAWMALGREDYNGQQYEQAAAAFAKVEPQRSGRP